MGNRWTAFDALWIRARTYSGEQVGTPADYQRGGAYALTVQPQKKIFVGGRGAYINSTFGRSLTRAYGAICRRAPSSRNTYTARDAPGPGRVDRSREQPGPAAMVRAATLKKFVCNTSEAGLFSGLSLELRRRPGHVRKLSRRYGRGERLGDGRPVLAGKYAVQCPAAAAGPYSK